MFLVSSDIGSDENMRFSIILSEPARMYGLGEYCEYYVSVVRVHPLYLPKPCEICRFCRSYSCMFIFLFTLDDDVTKS